MRQRTTADVLRALDFMRQYRSARITKICKQAPLASRSGGLAKGGQPKISNGS